MEILKSNEASPSLEIPGLELAGISSPVTPSLPQITGGHLPLVELGFGRSMPAEEEEGSVAYLLKQIKINKRIVKRHPQ
jgi:hypothetical protein